MGYSIFHQYMGIDDQIFENQYVLEKMIVWLINPQELNLSRFDPSEKNEIIKKNFQSHTRKKSNSVDLPPVKIYLEIETPGKNHNQRIPWIFTSIPLYG